MRGNRSRMHQWIDRGVTCCAVLGLAWGMAYMVLHALLVEADLREFGRPVYSVPSKSITRH